MVVVIIGILAGVVYAMIGNSDNSRRKAVLTTAKSIMPYAQECDFKGNDLVGPTNSHTGGGELCNGSVTNWPAIGDDNCDYVNGDADTYGIYCSDMENQKYVCCETRQGSCTESNSCP